MIGSFLQRFAATEGDGPAVHITPGNLFEVAGFTVTNSILYGLISAVVIMVFLTWAARKMTIRPKRGVIQFVEIGTDFIFRLLESSLGSREKAAKYAPTFITMFLFILLTNWIGLLPIIGEAFTYQDQPLFRPFTADLNGTLAISIVSMFYVQYYSIKESSPLKHLRHYFTGSLKNPITLFLGIFEMFSELTRIGSLALRLFLNIAIGETVIAVFAYLGGIIGPVTALPFTLLELGVGALQAYIFVMLSVMYLAVAVKHAEHDAHDDHPTIEETVETELQTANG